MHFDGLCFQVLVHGEQNEMARLKAALMREYEDDPDTKMEVHNPRNTIAVELTFRGEKVAKVGTFIFTFEFEESSHECLLLCQFI